MKNLFDDILTTELIKNNLDLNKLHDPTYKRESTAFLSLYDLFSIKNNTINNTINNKGTIVGLIYDDIKYLGKDSKENNCMKYSYKKFAKKNLRKYPYEILRPILDGYIRKDEGSEKEVLTKSMINKKTYFELSKGVYSHVHGRNEVYVKLVKKLCDVLLRDENGNKPELIFIYE